MKKFSLALMTLFLATAILTTSCKKDDEEELGTTTVAACDTAVYPTTTGDATIVLKNFSSDVIEVEAGNILSLAVEVTQGEKNVQKIRLFESDCKALLGAEVDLSDQPKGGKNGIDLRTTDEAQLRNVNYTIPTGYTTIYLSIEIDEKGGNISYKQLTLNVTGSGVINEYTDVTLGGNTNANASRMASGTGVTYTSCNAAENIDYIDLTYAVSLSDEESYLCSNPARFLDPIKLSKGSVSGCDDSGEESPTDGGKASYFKTSDADFDAATATELDALTISTSDMQYVKIAAKGDVFEFLSAEGQKGLIKVTGGTLDSFSGSITVSVKVAR